MAIITPEWPPKAPPSTVCWRAVQQYIICGIFGPFWARKREEISPKMASITCFWASKWTQICPEGPKNDSKTPPTVLYSCGRYYCLLFCGIQVILGWRKGRNQTQTLNFDNWHSIVFWLWTSITWPNFAQFQLPVPVLKTTKQGQHSDTTFKGQSYQTKIKIWQIKGRFYAAITVLSQN